MSTYFAQRRSIAFAFVLVALAAALSLVPLRIAHAQQSPVFDPAQVPPPAQTPMASAAAASYRENCAPCHGETGLSDGPVVADLAAPPPAFADPATAWERSPAEFFHTIKFGRMDKLMPPWSSRLSDDEIWNVAFYAWTLHTDKEKLAAAAERYQASCASCHGVTGAGDGPDADQKLTDYTDGSAMMLITQAALWEGWQSAHAELGADWSEGEQRTVLDYVRSFSYILPWDSGYRPGVGVVDGRVIQGSAGGDDVGGLTVRLRAFIDFTDVASFEVQADSEGRFRFEQLMSDPATVYMVEADAEGVRYGSDFFKFAAGSTQQTVDLTVYALGADESSIRVPRSNWVIDFEPGALVVGQIYAVSNTADRAYAGKQVDGVDRPVTVALPLPAGATLVEFPDGMLGVEYEMVDNMVYDTRAIPPGDTVRQIFITYRVPVDGKAAELTLPVGFNLESMNLLMGDLPELDATVADLTPQEKETIQGVDYRLWSGTSLAAGSSIQVAMEGVLTEDDVDPRAMIPTESDPTGESTGAATPTAEPLENRWVWVMGAALLAAMAGVFVWSTRTTKVDHSKALKSEQKALLHEIAALDDRHAAGELDDDSWAEARARLKTRLLVITSSFGSR